MTFLGGVSSWYGTEDSGQPKPLSSYQFGVRILRFLDFCRQGPGILRGMSLFLPVDMHISLFTKRPQGIPSTPKHWTNIPGPPNRWFLVVFGYLKASRNHLLGGTGLWPTNQPNAEASSRSPCPVPVTRKGSSTSSGSRSQKNRTEGSTVE